MENALSAAGSFLRSLPSGLVALFVLVGGFLAAYLLRLVVSWLLELVRFNKTCDRPGISEFLRKGQVRRQPSRLIGSLAWWTVLLITLLQIARALDIKVVNTFSDRLAAVAPGLLAGVFIGIVGLILVSFLGNFVMTLSRTAGFPHAGLLARAVKIAGFVLVLGLALEQVDISRSMISALFQILFAAIVFGLALAFGLGCKELARDASMRFFQNLRAARRRPHGPGRMRPLFRRRTPGG